MANIKFSQFTAEADIANFDDIVGYAGAVNTRITPANLASSLITLSGGPFLPIVAGVGNPLTGDLYIGDGTLPAVDLFINTSGSAGDETQISSQGQQFMFHEKGTEMKIGPNDEIIIDDSLTQAIKFTVDTIVQEELELDGDIQDIAGSTGANGFVLASKGGSGAGVEWVSGYKAFQTFVWNNGSPVAYVNFPPSPGSLPTTSALPFDPNALIATSNLPGGSTFSDYAWTCANAAGGDAGQVATFTLGANGAGTWRVSTLNHWFDQNSFIEVIVELVINGTAIQVTDERSNDGAGDKIYYGELYQTFSSGDTVQVQVTFQNSSTPTVTPFPSSAGNRPIEVNFEKIV